MSSNNSNKLNVPEARQAMDQFKMEAANEVGVPASYQFVTHYFTHICERPAKV